MTTPDSVLHQRVKGTFVGPVAPRLDQPQPAVVAINWNAYDVPRLWDMVRRDDDEAAWTQARGFENLAQLLLAHHDSLKRLRESLSNAWSPDTSPAAARFFGFLDALIDSLAEDAVAHGSTSRGVYSILTTLKTAKERVGQLKQEWDRVTTDWLPEWWDHAAENLNRRAREVMQRMDAAVGDYRQQLIVPSQYAYPTSIGSMALPEERSGYRAAVVRKTRDAAAATGEAEAEVAATAPPPAVPGIDPVMRRGPQLQGVANAPQLVAAVPGAPVSVLPVPPGNAYAPGGGAYVLPGPGIGHGRWVYPMPPPQSTPTHHANSTMSPLSTMRQHANTDRGKRTMVWQVASGVPPVIGEASAQEALAEEQLRLAEAEFADWFADLATPWTDDLKVDLPRTETGS
ncbi:hypothetical protein [Allorhizocola rhizosphaerae]|uniref:hypothetical protein n=1 Tax=Allorhizocola rhizosphaerae TaxID=1872709 RepID=UPI000E3C0B32|nr:hypothetical protein [Allorhizocola rhizosphaerae]